MAAHLERLCSVTKSMLGCQSPPSCVAGTSHLLRRSACPLSVLFLLPRSLAPRLSGSIPSLGTSMVANDLRPCVSADHEHLRALHDAGVDEHDLTGGSLVKAVSLVDKPACRLWSAGHVRACSRLVCEGSSFFVWELSLFPASPAFWPPRPS